MLASLGRADNKKPAHGGLSVEGGADPSARQSVLCNFSLINDGATKRRSGYRVSSMRAACGASWQLSHQQKARARGLKKGFLKCAGSIQVSRSETDVMGHVAGMKKSVRGELQVVSCHIPVADFNVPARCDESMTRALKGMVRRRPRAS